MKVEQKIYIPIPERLLNVYDNKPPFEKHSRSTPLAQEIFQMLEGEKLSPKFSMRWPEGESSINKGYIITVVHTITLWTLIKDLFKRKKRDK